MIQHHDHDRLAIAFADCLRGSPRDGEDAIPPPPRPRVVEPEPMWSPASAQLYS